LSKLQDRAAQGRAVRDLQREKAQAAPRLTGVYDSREGWLRLSPAEVFGYNTLFTFVALS
jgi:hypothetical protein